MPATAYRIPLNSFSVPFGLAGLGGSWMALANDGRTPRTVGDALLALAALVWLTVLGGYLRHVLSDRSALRRDLLDPVDAPFGSLAVITPMLLAADGLYRYAPGVGKALVDVLLVLTVGLGAWFTAQWIYGPVALDRFHPGYFLPTVAGGMVASAGAAEAGQRLLAEVMFGLGAVCYLMLGPVIVGRRAFRPALPEPLLPTLAINVAPAAVASLAYFAIDGDHVDFAAAVIGGYGLLMALAQLPLVPMYARLRFSPTTWAFTFCWAAVATTALHWLGDTRPGGYRVWEYVVIAAITTLIGSIAVRTMVAIGRRQFLPVPAARDTREAPA
jgi:tellurite resistance protein